MFKPSEISNQLHRKAILSTAILCGVLYYLVFFWLKPWIVDAHLPNQEWINSIVSPYIYLIDEHDGKEGEFLIIATLLILPLSQIVFFFLKKIKVNFIHTFMFWLGIVFGLLVCGYTRFFVWESIFSWYGFLSLFLLLFATQIQHERLSLLVVLILALILIMPYQQVSYYDYAFVAGPATKLLQDGDFSSFLSQYDLLISLPAIVAEYFGGGASLHILLNRIIVFGFAFLVYFTSRGLVGNRYAFFLFFLWFLMKYVSTFDSVVIAASSPLRVEAWLLIFILAMRCGVFHLFTAIVAGFLIVVHFNFGFLYALGFVVFCAYSWLLDVMAGRTLSAAFSAAKKMLLPLAVLILSFVIHFVIFGQWFSEAIVKYRSLQIGMMPLAKDSIFWIYPVLYIAVFLSIVSFYFSPKKNVQAMLLLVFISILAMSYYFGRSHYKVISVLATSAILLLGWLMTQRDYKRAILPIRYVVVVFWLLLIFEKPEIESKIEVIQEAIKQRSFIQPQTPVLSESEVATINLLNQKNKPLAFLMGGGQSYYYAQQLRQPLVTNPIPIDAILEMDTLVGQLNRALQSNIYIVAKVEDHQAREVIKRLQYSASDTLDGFQILQQ